jgi:deoxyribonuclease-4
MSIAGGYYKAVEAASAAGCDCVQLFTKNNNQWRAKPVTEDEAILFRSKLKELNITNPVSHASYLINLASPNEELRQKSIDAMLVELQRAEQLGIPFVIVHPGSCTTSDENSGIKAICRSLDRIYQSIEGMDVKLLLENTAGQGSNLGWRFEQLQAMIEGTRFSTGVGVCFDTCHAFSAGYELGNVEGYSATFDELQRRVGLNRIKAFHLNDSKQPRGARKDRHEHIGRGEMGLEPFRNLLNDERFVNVPMYLETEKGREGGRDLDVINLETLRSLLP